MSLQTYTDYSWSSFECIVDSVNTVLRRIVINENDVFAHAANVIDGVVKRKQVNLNPPCSSNQNNTLPRNAK